MTRVAALVVLLAVAGSGVAAPVPKALKAKPATLDGEWELTGEERDGNANAKRSSRYNRWQITGNVLVLMADPSPQRDPLYRATLDSKPADGVPRTFEYTGENGYHRRGVCEVDGDTLRVGFVPQGKEIPDNLELKNGLTVYELKRLKDDK